jgi:hypothetical protein
MTMKRIPLLFTLALAAGALMACSGDNGTEPEPDDELVGTWVSQGTDIAPGLAATLKTKRIDATFNKNNTYTVLATDSANAVVTFTGTWTATGTEGAIRAITLGQSAPTTLTSEGIFQVVGTRLTYEVIQTSPPITGFTAPTVAEGFGSTKYNGIALGATWTQRFSKQ